MECDSRGKKPAHDHEMDFRLEQWIIPWMMTINIFVMMINLIPCVAYYCDFAQCRWTLDKATGSLARLTYEHMDDNDNYRPRGRSEYLFVYSIYYQVIVVLPLLFYFFFLPGILIFNTVYSMKIYSFAKQKKKKNIVADHRFLGCD